MNLYPLKFSPIVKDKIWGGTKLKTLLNKDLGQLPNGGESWELSAVKGDVSVVLNGKLAGQSLVDVINAYGADLMGRHVYAQFGADFPLLIKFIDANDNLSVQVHPDDELAARRHGSFGKTEMWYVMDADEGASLISGFSEKISATDYERRLALGHFVDALAAHKVRQGDVFFMPAGRIHAIGKGVMVAEIQQTSDITYRVYDYDRRDAVGRSRQLHVDEALAAINFDDLDSGKIEYRAVENQPVPVVSCKYFDTSVIVVCGSTTLDFSQTDSFEILMCVEGKATISAGDFSTEMSLGETLLVPACTDSVKVDADSAKMLNVFIP